MGQVLFHLAFPVTDLEDAKRFYVDGLGCSLGRMSNSAITLNLNGNQLVGHLTKKQSESPKSIYPRHFGLVFVSEEDWQAMADRALNGRAMAALEEPAGVSRIAAPAGWC